MKNRLRFLLALILVLGLGLALISTPVFAGKCAGVETSVINCEGEGAGAVRHLLLEVLDIMTIGIGVLAVVGISIVGVQYLTAGGNEQQTTKAKRRMLEIVIGLAAYAVLWTAAQWLLPGGSLTGSIGTESVSITSKSVSIPVGSSKTISAQVYPLDADDRSLTWSSSDNSIATVDSSGKVTAKKQGSVTITAKTKDGKEAKVTVNVTKQSSSSGSSGGSSSGSSGPSKSGKHKIGKALAVMHADSDGNINKVRKAVNKKYWAVECDLGYRNSKLYCFHVNHYSSSKSKTIDKTVSIAKKGGSKVIIDMKAQSSTNAALSKLGAYIKKNKLQNWVIIQNLDNVSKMKTLNNKAGSKLEYWGLAMSGSKINTLVNKAKTYKKLGMTGVNVQQTYATKSSVKKLKKAGFEVCIFTWNSFKKSEIKKYNNYNTEYLMTHDVSQ